MKKNIIIIFGIILLSISSNFVFATEIIEDIEDIPNIQVESMEENTFPETKFIKAKVIEVKSIEEEINGTLYKKQDLRVEILNGDRKGDQIEVLGSNSINLDKSQTYREGDRLIVSENKYSNEITYSVYDRDRINGILMVTGIFFLFAMIVTKLKGLGSIIGLFLSILVLMSYILPAIIKGQDPLIVTLIGTLFTASISLFMAHGFRLRTTIAFISLMITFIFSYFVSWFFANISLMFGAGEEGAFYTQYLIQDLNNVTIDLKGLYLAGIMIGMLGVLDDVTIAQSSALDEIKRANPKIKFKQLYLAGVSIGREHIASLINTLALAYVGASLPLFLTLYVNERNDPLWVILNSEYISQEIIRTMAGSFAIVLAVPITTFISAKVYTHPKIKLKKNKKGEISHTHHH